MRELSLETASLAVKLWAVTARKPRRDSRGYTGMRLHIQLSLVMKIILTSLAVFLAGCAARHQNETIAGVVVPIPAPMKKLPVSEDWVDLGLEQKGEQVSFRGEMSRSEIVQFYQNVLPADGWKPDARLGAEIGGYVFTRESQTIAIRINENDSNTSTLTVFAKTGEFRPGAA